jgi:transcriptional regulator with XRE-family HTH domain
MESSSLIDIAIATTIKRYREKQNISMDEMARRLNITPYVFRNKACVTNTAHQFKSDELTALILLTGDRTITRAYDDLLERGNNDVSADDIVHMLIDLGIDQGHALEVVKRAIADGIVTSTELRETTMALSKAIENYQVLEKALVALASKKRLKSVALA